MKTITEQFIKEKLMAKYEGQKVSGYDYISVASTVAQILRDYFQDCDEVNYKDFGCKYDKWHLVMTYKGSSIGSVDIKRKKGQSHYGYFGNWCDWTFKDFCVYVKEDLIGTIADIEGYLDAKALEEAKKMAQYKEIFEYIQQKYNLDKYDTSRFIEGMHNKRYSLY